MCAVLFYLFFPINIYLSLSIQPSFFLSSILGGAGGGGGVNDRADFRPGCSCYWSSK